MGDPDQDGLETPEGETVAFLRGRLAELEEAAREAAQLRDELAALRAEQAELRAMVRASTDLVIILDADGRYLKIAPTAPGLLYRPGDELLGKTLHEVMPRALADFFLDSIRRALATGAAVSLDYSLPIDGNEVFFSVSVSPFSPTSVLFLGRDVTALRRAEHQRQRAQEEVLAQLLTPLIPISDEILVLPLIGALDPGRLDGITGALLEGVQGRRARFAIVDLTGVPSLDARSAEGLVRAARAVQLLGARVILSGIRAGAAQALVASNIDLGGVDTSGTLQAAIAHASRISAAGPAAP